ncbi:MAG: 16S rRNA (cytidine(1402)-2'-O)-methyltransferase [Ruminococcaceae bacterium]|nr:16S rRNA (cytidine(1402)-2'-O)-methyltransferase [Oscillospiraceae bacterium]
MNCGTLYLVATPIGNLGDLSARALEILHTVDLIACEDTRHSLKLLNHFGISKPLTSYFEHNKSEKGQYLLAELLSGKNIALVTDAGTPAISDPGEDLVALCIQNDIPTVSIPGAAAFVSALIVSGLPTRQFLFEGFLPVGKKARAEQLQPLRTLPHTLIFYEAPHKLARTLQDLLDCLGDRRICLARELTKLHEEILRTTISGAISHYESHSPKGEYVLVVEGADAAALQAKQAADLSLIPVAEQVDALIAQGMDKKDALKETARLRGVSKREIYNIYVREGEQ